MYIHTHIYVIIYYVYNLSSYMRKMGLKIRDKEGKPKKTKLKQSVLVQTENTRTGKGLG